jgi:hypothetical protein
MVRWIVGVKLPTAGLISPGPETTSLNTAGNTWLSIITVGVSKDKDNACVAGVSTALTVVVGAFNPSVNVSVAGTLGLFCVAGAFNNNVNGNCPGSLYSIVTTGI